MLNFLIVIPTYNNANTLRGVVERVSSTGLPVLVVNDGSTDGTADVLRGLDIASISFPENRGKGAAILAGAQCADEKGFSHIITIDADGQHDPADLPKFCEAIKKDPISIVVGKRQFNEDVPFSSRFGRKFSNMWLWITSGKSVSDSQSGFRAYPVTALREIKCGSRRYDFEVEILVRGVWAGLDLHNVDIRVHYSDETIRTSSFDPLLDNLRISKVYTILFARNYTPLPHKKLFNIDEDRLSLLHPIETIKTLLCERLTPKEIAYAAMLGVFMGALPLIAFHTIAIFFVASRLRLNRMLAIVASNICMPPFVPAIEIEVGHYIRYGKYLTEFNMQTLAYEADQRLIEYLLGSLVVGPLLAVSVGVIAYIVASAYYKLSYERNLNDGKGR